MQQDKEASLAHSRGSHIATIIRNLRSRDRHNLFAIETPIQLDMFSEASRSPFVLRCVTVLMCSGMMRYVRDGFYKNDQRDPQFTFNTSEYWNLGASGKTQDQKYREMDAEKCFSRNNEAPGCPYTSVGRWGRLLMTEDALSPSTSPSHLFHRPIPPIPTQIQNSPHHYQSTKEPNRIHKYRHRISTLIHVEQQMAKGRRNNPKISQNRSEDGSFQKKNQKDEVHEIGDVV
ncbi:hypothetical protein M501DRAFT_1019003 [Patellaria atrata CBS 101060]|uniref:Uncharacterized protein n=1 Tax=Patellaria atrata CBS 101060 TaxID=1346257 RepID=A0A9P4S4W9_9PEZI|nr:hypothetical protein M501DRAFT_1019003 [Patellaria atrata CBS 101060]